MSKKMEKKKEKRMFVCNKRRLVRGIIIVGLRGL
jgi:hypothetical protein